MFESIVDFSFAFLGQDGWGAPCSEAALGFPRRG